MTNRRTMVIFLTVLVILTSALLIVMIGCAQPEPSPAPAPAPTPAPAPSPAPTPAPAPAPAPAEKIELRLPMGSQGMTGVSKPTIGRWVEEVEAVSNGRVKINVLVGACPDPEIFDVVAKGAGDVGGNPIMFNTGRFPTMESMNLPDLGMPCQHPGRVAWEFWKETPQVDKEFGEARLTGIFAPTISPPGVSFATVDKPVYSLEDLQGMKIGIYGEWGTKTLAALGAVPVAVPPPDVYESCQRKIIDGSCMDPEMLEAMNIYEVVKYWHNINFLFSPYWMVVNWDTWNSLPPDIQQIFDDAAAKIPDWADSYLKEAVVRAIEHGKSEYGMEVIDYSEEELNRWRERQQPVQDEYIALLDSKGVDGKKVFAELLRLEEKYSEW